MEYQDILKKTPEEAAKQLVTDFGNKAYQAVLLARNNTPMYCGELNPKWQFWNEVMKIVGKQPAEFTISESGYKTYPQ